MPHYAALGVSNEETAIHVIDETGATVWRGKRPSDPDVLTTTLRRHAPDLARVGLETGPLTSWLYHTCKALGLHHRLPGRAACTSGHRLATKQD
jgi:transposase